MDGAVGARDALRDLLPVVREYRDSVAEESVDDDFSSPDANDPPTLVGMIMRILQTDGWLEQFAERTGLVTAFRLPRPGMESAGWVRLSQIVSSGD
jgi:hypothetical protein